MATLNNHNPTLADVTARMDKNGNIVTDIVEILNETNEILPEATFLEANGTTDHTTVVRTGLPTAAWRELYKGVPTSKSHVARVKDAIGMLEARSLIDEELARLNGNSAAWRLSEERPFIEAVNQEMTRALFYGSQAQNGAAFNGLSMRYSDKSAANGRNIVDGGGTGADNTSVWLMVWSPTTAHMIYPKGFPAGLEQKDLGVIQERDENNNPYEVMSSKFMWKTGFVLRDWRYVVRIANIDVKKLTKDAKAGADLIDLMTDALELVPNINAGRAVFYCNREIRSFLRRQITNKVVGSTLAMDDVAGKKVVTFDGVPVRICDQLLNTESRVA